MGVNMSLGGRIKRYEKVTRHFATQRMPLIIRVDGKAFHTFTKDMSKPFDNALILAMVRAARDTAEVMQGFKAAYIQSDEVTFCLTDYDKTGSQGWFGYNIQKIISISAATMSVNFNKHLPTNRSPVFDSRAFNVPKEDVVNTFLWRAQDWERNSLQMYARAFFSHKELHKKNKSNIHEMLRKIGKNWITDLRPEEKNGSFIIPDSNGVLTLRQDITPRFEVINKLLQPLIQN